MADWKKYILMFIITFALVALDLGTKRWAELSLATPYRPIPIAVDKDSDGKPLGELLEARLGSLPEDAWIKEFVLRTGTDHVLKDDTRIFQKNGKPAIRHIYAFTEKDLQSAPRLVLNNDYERERQWLKYAEPKMKESAMDEKLGEAASNQTLVRLLATHIPFLDEESAKPIAQGHAYRLAPRPKSAKGPDGQLQPLSKDTIVQDGDIFLVTHWSIDVVDSYLRFSYAENPGAAWGFLGETDPQFRHVFFILISILAGGVILFFVIRLENKHMIHLVAFSAILSGAIGNFVDRIRYRYVVDFIDMYIGDSHWPTYNVADIAITVGVALLIIDMIRHGDDSPLMAATQPKEKGDEA